MGNQTHVRNGFAILAWACLSLAAGSAKAGQVCSLIFDQCPGAFKSGVVQVPKNVIWLESRIPICSENVSVPVGTEPVPPSLVFIIDNSGSMGWEKYPEAPGTDPGVARFEVTRKMIDSIYATAPGTEVGVVVFTHRLAFDARDLAYFQRAFPGDSVQFDSFIPLTRLDKAFANGRKGIDTLKSLLAYTGKGNLKYQTTRGTTRMSKFDSANTRDGTDITLGFEAAKGAMRTAKADPSGRYFIFLSDGMPSGVDGQREGVKDEYVKGDSVPTTFTIYFKGNAEGGDPLKQIEAMTKNIQANGYSASNAKSAWYGIETPGSQLLKQMQGSIKTIFDNKPAQPKGAQVATDGRNYQNSGMDARNFTFTKPIPLTGDRTQVAFNYAFTYQDSGRTLEKNVPYTLSVDRVDNVAIPSGLSQVCREQGSITLHANGARIDAVKDEHARVDVHLALGEGGNCAGCKVEARSLSAGDAEGLAMAPASGYHAGSFTHAAQGAIQPGDGRIQHRSPDSLVLLYVNPDNALDRIEARFPFLATVPSVLALGGHYQDRDGDGRIETAVIRFDTAFRQPPETILLRDPFSGGAPGEILQRAVEGRTMTLTLKPFAAGTGFGKEATASLSGGPGYAGQTFVLADSVGPVLVKAESFPSADPAVRSYLDVGFSEPVTLPAAERAFPYTVKRAGTAIAQGEIIPVEIRVLAPNRERYFFAAASTYPVPGDSIRIAEAGGPRDANGNPGRMGFYLPVTGGAAQVEARIEAALVYPVTRRKDLVSPSAAGDVLAIHNGKACVNCDSPGLRSLLGGDAAGDVAAQGPTWRIQVAYPFRYDLGIFDNLGNYVNRISGEVTAAQLAALRAAAVPGDTSGLRFTLLPYSSQGRMLASGAYILAGTLHVPDQPAARGRQGEAVRVKATSYRLVSRFGLLRRK